MANRPIGIRWARAALLVNIALLAGCGGESPPRQYPMSALEAQSAAQQFIDECSASAIMVALVDANRIVWTGMLGSAPLETR